MAISAFICNTCMHERHCKKWNEPDCGIYHTSEEKNTLMIYIKSKENKLT